MIKRGEIYWYENPLAAGSIQAGRRPVLIVQNDQGNRLSTTTIVASITSQPRSRKYPFHVPFTADESGLRLDGLIMCEQLVTANQAHLGPLIGALGPERMEDVDRALHASLGLRV